MNKFLVSINGIYMHVLVLIVIIIFCLLLVNCAISRFTVLEDRGTHYLLSLLIVVLVLSVYLMHNGSKSIAVTQTDYSDSFMIFTDGPKFSRLPGFYDREFDLSLSYLPGWTIYYTTDGSIPNESSVQYLEPIHIYDRSNEPNVYRSIPNFTLDWYYDEIDTTPVSKGVVVRAVAFGPQGECSDVVTGTYFVNQSSDGLAVLSLVGDPDDLFGDNGIYSTGRLYDEWYQGDRTGEEPEANFNIHGLEVPADAELFLDETLYMSQPVGLRILGASQRAQRFKRMSVISRKQYSGSKVFYKEIFPDKKTHAFGLRSGFENAFSMYLSQDRDVAYQASFPVRVYLNGEFWYDTYLQERYNETFFRETYGVKSAEFIKQGMTDEITEFLSKNDLSDDSAYREFDRIVDIQSYIDYLCINIYLANADYSDMDNIAMWRSLNINNRNKYADGRWRYCLYDLDLETALIRSESGMEDISDAEYDSFHNMADWSQPVSEWPMFTALKKNENFCRQFVLSFMDMVNTDFDPERVEKLLKDWDRDITYDNGFFLDRPELITGYMADEFGLTGTPESLKISVNDSHKGIIIVNTCAPELKNGKWEGKYFTDYPVTLKAVPKEGYRFARWEGGVASDADTIEVTVPEGGISVKAVFRRDL